MRSMSTSVFIHTWDKHKATYTGAVPRNNCDQHCAYAYSYANYIGLVLRVRQGVIWQLQETAESAFACMNLPKTRQVCLMLENLLKLLGKDSCLHELHLMMRPGEGELNGALRQTVFSYSRTSLSQTRLSRAPHCLPWIYLSVTYYGISQIPDISNYFLFPLRVRDIGVQLLVLLA